MRFPIIRCNKIKFQANENEIKAAYRRMCVLYHPDKHHDPAKKKVSMLFKLTGIFFMFDCVLKVHEMYSKNVSSTLGKYYCNNNKNYDKA